MANGTRQYLAALFHLPFFHLPFRPAFFSGLLTGGDPRTHLVLDMG
jgi:hypothetical protein